MYSAIMTPDSPWPLGLRGPRGRWAVLDVQTTGLVHPRVVEVALVGPKGEVLFHSLVRPPVPITPEATEIHGITDAMVADAPTFEELTLDFYIVLAELEGLVAFNDTYERLCLRHEEIPPLHVVWFGAQILCEYCFRNPPRERTSLRAACRRLGVPYVRGRGAVAEARATLGVIDALGWPSEEE